MAQVQNTKSYTGLIISNYDSENINPLLPLLSEEFPNWSVAKIKSYISTVIKKKQNIAGVLVAQNEAFYYVGLLVYTFQQITSENFGKNQNENQFIDGLIIENLVASSPILQKQVFMTLVEEAIRIANTNSCAFVELPKLDESYQLVKKKYQNQITNVNGFRTFLKI